MDQETIQKIADSFRGEVNYLQGDGYMFNFETRKLRWLSICTIIFELEFNLGLPPDTLFNLSGMRRGALDKFHE